MHCSMYAKNLSEPIGKQSARIGLDILKFSTSPAIFPFELFYHHHYYNYYDQRQ